MRRWAKFAGFRPRHIRAAVFGFSVLCLVLADVAWSSGPAVASVGTDQTDITQLEQQIAAQGAQAQALVSRFNEAQARVDSLDAQIAHDHTLVAADQRVEASAASAVQQVAVTAYVSGSSVDASALTMFSGTWSASRMLEQNQYLAEVNTKLDGEITALHLDRVRTQDAQSGLQAEQAQAKKSLDQLKAAHDAATSAIAADQAKLSHVQGNLRSLLAAAAERQHASQAAAERALAAAASSTAIQLPVPLSPPSSTLPPSSSNTPPTSPPPPPGPPPTPPPLSSSSGYANPFRDAVALSSERIDQGVDYSGVGPVYAIGDGVVLCTYGSGWPGGTFIGYQLTDGPASGLVVYVAEDVEPSVQVGATVTSGTVLGQMYAGPDGIETGWADASAMPDTMARAYQQFNGANSSAFGYNFSQFLQSLGAPGGIVDDPLTGVLPAGWPNW